MTTSRTVLKVALAPVIGTRIQPTGFPDLGAAEYTGPDKTPTLLVESAQSMANRLEETTWDTTRDDQPDELAALPYVRVVDPDGTFLTSSRIEAHRLACAYIREGSIDGGSGSDFLLARFGLRKGRPLDYRAVARAIFALDPLSLVHGVFFAIKPWPWQPKVTRAVTSFIEAYGYQPAISGGVKRDSVVNTGGDGASSEGYGMVPFHRTEYTAETITAYFCVDHHQLRGYGLSAAATALLEAVIDFEIATLLAGGLRLRTACDLAVTGIEQGEVPERDDAVRRIAEHAAACADELGARTTVVWSGRSSKKGEKSEKTEKSE